MSRLTTPGAAWLRALVAHPVSQRPPTPPTYHRCGDDTCTTEDHGEHDRTLLQLLAVVVRRLVRCDTDLHLDARRRHHLDRRTQ